MNMTKKVGLMVGSLRSGSYNKIIASALTELDDSVEYQWISIAELPLYNDDLDQGEVIEAVKKYRAAIEQVDGIIIVSPEYNSGIPGVLKNALDWASTPPMTAALRRKPVGVVGATTGPKGTILSQQQIRQTLEAIQAYVLPFHKMYISQVKDKIDTERGILTDETTRKYLQRYLQHFIRWIDQVPELEA
jgi:chromate reductase